MIIPISTNTTIATCIQIQVGDIRQHSLPRLHAHQGGPSRTLTGARAECRDYRVRHGSVCPTARWLALALSADRACLRAAGAGERPRRGARSCVPPPRRREHRRASSPSSDAVRTPTATIAERAGPRARSVVRRRCPGRYSSPTTRSTIERASRWPSSTVSSSDARADRHRRDRDRRQHALLGLLGAAALLAACVPGQATARPTPGRRANPRDYAAFVAYLAARYGTRAGRDRGLERARPGQRRLLRRARQGPALRGGAARRLPRDQAGQPGRAGARRLARGLQRRLPARPLRRRHQGLLRRPRGALLQPHARPRCARSTKRSSPTATARRCGSTSSAGAAAGRASGSSRNRRASRPDPGANLAQHDPRARAHPLRRGGGASTSSQDSAAEDFGVLSRRAAPASPPSARSRGVLRSPFGAVSPRDAEPCASRARASSPAAPAPSATSCSSKPSRARAALPGAVHARPLQPLLDPAAARARHARPARARLPVLDRAGARRRRGPSEHSSAADLGRRRARRSRHSALRKSATSVSARIFRSSPSDQWAM